MYAALNIRLECAFFSFLLTHFSSWVILCAIENFTYAKNNNTLETKLLWAFFRRWFDCLEYWMLSRLIISTNVRLMNLINKIKCNQSRFLSIDFRLLNTQFYWFFSSTTQVLEYFYNTRLLCVTYISFYITLLDEF
jgi:hypothetical protein